MSCSGLPLKCSRPFRCLFYVFVLAVFIFINKINCWHLLRMSKAERTSKLCAKYQRNRMSRTKFNRKISPNENMDIVIQFGVFGAHIDTLSVWYWQMVRIQYIVYVFARWRISICKMCAHLSTSRERERKTLENTCWCGTLKGAQAFSILGNVISFFPKRNINKSKNLKKFAKNWFVEFEPCELSTSSV